MERSTSELASDVRSVQGALDWELRAKEQFDTRLRALQARVLDQSHRLHAQRTFLAAAAARWATTEDQLVRLAGAAPRSAGGQPSTSMWDWLLGEVRQAAYTGPLPFAAAIFGLLGVEGWSRSAGISGDLFGIEHEEHSTRVYVAKGEAHGQLGVAHGDVKGYVGTAEAGYKPLSISASGVQASAGHPSRRSAWRWRGR